LCCVADVGEKAEDCGETGWEREGGGGDSEGDFAWEYSVRSCVDFWERAVKLVDSGRFHDVLLLCASVLVYCVMFAEDETALVVFSCLITVLCSSPTLTPRSILSPASISCRN
jgi:hypothetical protein